MSNQSEGFAGLPQHLQPSNLSAQEPSATPSTLERLVQKWRTKADEVDGYHATMGTGWHACADELEAALRPSEGPPQEPTREWFQKRCAWYQQELERITAALPAGPETGDRERLRAEARARHDACVLGHLSNTTSHVSPFIWCPHPACVLVRQAAPAASEGQKS